MKRVVIVSAVVGTAVYFLFKPLFLESVKNDRFRTVYFMIPFASKATINEGFGIYLKHWRSGMRSVYPILVPVSDLNFVYDNATPLMRAAIFNDGDLTKDLLYRNASLSAMSINGTAISIANNLGSHNFLNQVVRHRKSNDIYLSDSDELILQEYVKPKTITIASGNDNFVIGKFRTIISGDVSSTGTVETSRPDPTWWSLLWG